METSIRPKAPDPLQRLSGAVVLVESTRDHRNPPTALRGTIEVYQANDEQTSVVKIALDYPQMFNTPAHHRTITLNDAQAAELIASESAGVYRICLDVDLRPEE